MADFTTTPDLVFDETSEFKTLVSKFENGFEQRRAKWSSDLRMFRLVFKGRSKTVFETVRDFYLGKYGQLTNFTWENPNDSVEYTVRFEKDSLRFSQIAHEVYKFEFRLKEVRS